MRILAIETSCDETSIAVINTADFRFEILSNIVSSQIKVHQKWGGVVPALAKREHQKNLVSVLERALKEARLLEAKNKKQKTKIETGNLQKILEREPDLYEKSAGFLKKYSKPAIDAIAVTVGPGLEPALWVGVNFAKALSFFWGLPIIPVNHVKAHILANFIGEKLKSTRHLGDSNLFPAVCLVVSGGHTQLVLMRGFKDYKILGETRDDAAGECFDKVAKILGLGYPGGPVVANNAAKARRELPLSVKLPRPMIYTKDYDFSFSGLKTAVLYEFKKQPEKIKKSKAYIQEICREVQQSIIDVLIFKTLKAAKDIGAKSIVLGGGVTANAGLRKQFKERINKELPNTKYLVPDIKFCTDNGAMIGVTAFLDGKSQSWQETKVDANLKIQC